MVAQWRSLTEFATDLNVPIERAREMAQRSLIDREVWPRVVESAMRRGLAGITLHRLEATGGIEYKIDETKPKAKHAPKPDHHRTARRGGATLAAVHRCAVTRNPSSSLERR